MVGKTSNDSKSVSIYLLSIRRLYADTKLLINKQSQLLIESKILPRVTTAHTPPTLHTDQASAKGNAIVTKEPRRITQTDTTELFKSRLTVVTGDLLTVNRVLSLKVIHTLYAHSCSYRRHTRELELLGAFLRTLSHSYCCFHWDITDALRQAKCSA